jgi:hypothetical protein
MQKHQTNVVKFAAICVTIVTLFSVSGCSSRPVLKNVSDSAQDQPINTPEQAKLIQLKNSK